MSRWACCCLCMALVDTIVILLLAANDAGAVQRSSALNVTAKAVYRHRCHGLAAMVSVTGTWPRASCMCSM